MFGRGISVKGEIRSLEDLTFEGHVEGPIVCEEGAVTVASGATILGDLIARDVTVLGNVEGQIVATDVVDVRSGSIVTGKVIAKRFILSDGANFVGRVEPQHLEAALRVAKHQQRKRDTV